VRVTYKSPKRSVAQNVRDAGTFYPHSYPHLVSICPRIDALGAGKHFGPAVRGSSSDNQCGPRAMTFGRRVHWPTGQYRRPPLAVTPRDSVLLLPAARAAALSTAGARMLLELSGSMPALSSFCGTGGGPTRPSGPHGTQTWHQQGASRSRFRRRAIYLPRDLRLLPLRSRWIEDMTGSSRGGRHWR
jgi:hypothetical protein